MFLALALLLTFSFQPADSIRTADMAQVEVVGTRERLSRLPGSGSVLLSADLRAISPLTGGEIFRKVSGLHVVEEEGLGLRMNIGVRGLDPDRSRTVLMLEDGIPVSLAPYGEPEMYYTPTIDRMSGVEVLKGSGSILFGPQTFGGVVNYRTANPPAEPTTSVRLRGGADAFFTGLFSHGSTVGNVGYHIGYLRKSGAGVGILDYGIHDLNAKLRLVLAPNSVLGFKLGVYDETSNSTYVGISQGMYDSGDFDYTHPAPDDALAIRRYSASLVHDYFWSPDVRLKTTVFGYTTTRNWSRQEFHTAPNPGTTYVRTLGDLYFRNQTGNRNRQFEVAGVEPRFSANMDLGGLRHELDLGVRYLFERAYEQRIDGTVARPTSGTLREDEIRTGHAWSAYLQNRIFLTDAFTVTPGVRIEHFRYERDIRRLANAEVNRIEDDVLTQIIPGIGLNHVFTGGWSAFAGVHRGFGPPRVKDAISNDGVAQQLDAELSWNYEIGFRRDGRALSGELTGFYLDFENQIIPVSESSGGTGAPGVDLVNGGETRHIGLEAAVSADVAALAGLGFGLEWDASATWTRATFASDRIVNNGGTPENINGNTLPYAPEFLLTSGLGLEPVKSVRLDAHLTWISDQFGDELNLETPSADGRRGPLAGHLVLDANLAYTLPLAHPAILSVSAKNLLDERYIVSRRPQGIRLGMPRFVTLGLEIGL